MGSRVAWIKAKKPAASSGVKHWLLGLPQCDRARACPNRVPPSAGVRPTLTPGKATYPSPCPVVWLSACLI